MGFKENYKQVERAKCKMQGAMCNVQCAEEVGIMKVFVVEAKW